jgi:hypothetical protein
MERLDCPGRFGHERRTDKNNFSREDAKMQRREEKHKNINLFSASSRLCENYFYRIFTLPVKDSHAAMAFITCPSA